MDSRYKQEVAKYGKKDAIIAICYFVYWLIIGTIGIMHREHVGGWTVYQSLFAVIVVQTLPCIAIVLIMKQKLRSLGFTKDNLGKNLLYGVLVGPVPFLVYLVVVHFILGFEFQAMSFLALSFVYTLAHAAREDLVFVGFIQTRIYGLIKNDRLAVIVGGAIFSAMHWPMFLFWFEGAQIGYMVAMAVLWVLAHIYLMNSVYRTSLSIFPVIMLHTFFNFASFSHMWTTERPEWPFYMLIALTLAAVHIYRRHLNRRNKKAEEGASQ
jgi:hypothetical protein